VAAPRAAGGPATATLFVSYSGLMGGSERILLDLATGLEPVPVLACPDGPLAERAREAGLRVFPIRTRRLELRATLHDRVAKPLRIVGHAREVRELAFALRPGVVFAWGTRALIACAAGLRGLEPTPALIFQNMDMLQGPVIARIARAAAREADLVVAPSAAVAQDFGPRGALDERSVVVAPGIDVGAYEPYGPHDGPRRALLLGALVAWKRPRLALEAVALASRELPDLELTVAGPIIDAQGKKLLELLRRRAELSDLAGRVHFAGALPDPRDELQRSSCLLHCADWEPFGMVVLEALACALPVAAPRCGGPAEIVNEECGRLYAPGDARAASEALVYLLSSRELARRVGEAGRTRVERNYGLDDFRGRYMELIEEVGPRPAGAARARPASRGPGHGIALVTVLHDSEPEVRAFLASVSRHLPEAHVVAVDSGSRDRGADAVRAWSGRATVIELNENVGFGRASNAGIGAVDEPATVLVNPDVELVDGSLAALAAEVAREDRPERILAPLVMEPEGAREGSAHHEPGSPPELLAAVLPPAALPAALRAQIQPWRADGPRRVGWAVGCCLVARTDTLRRLGPFDERAFMYAEDLDLGLRASDAGIETWFWPDARVVHRRAHAARRAFRGEPFGLLARRRREVVRKWRGRRREEVDDWTQLVTFANRMALKALLGRSATRERRQLAALLDARRDETP
jgi:N-acetylglucosaminyl-diphospho-decaprenol L-rhamnosyltransferase